MSRADGVPAEIDQLRFFVGMGVEPDRMALVDDRDPESEVTFAAGRDLLADPYRLLLRPTAAAEGMSIMVAVVGFSDGQVVGFGSLEQPVAFIDGKVLEWDILLTSEGGGRVDITDTGCLKWTTDADTIIIAPPDDRDCDNDLADVDCNDEDPTIGPTKSEICFNQIDDDCDGTKDEEQDLDMDGVGNCDDCDDTNDKIAPGKPEICDGLDNDCSGFCDDGPLDADGDFYNTCGSKIFDDGTCSDPHPNTTDCDDDNELVYPEADEICDGFDNDCNGKCDEDFDPDGDEYTFCGSKITACAGRTHPEFVDCEPDDERVYPFAEERCDGVDNNCDGVFYPATVPCYAENTETGTCLVGTRQCGDANGGEWLGDCTPTADEVAADSLCQAYDDCDSADAADPFACANMGAATNNVDCNLYVSPQGLCPNRAVVLPNASNGTCLWTILGGGQQKHYQVSLRSLESATNTGGVLAECAAGFAVLSATTMPPATDSVYLSQKVDTTNVQVLGLHLHPEPVTDCPQQGGLQCNGLNPVPAN